MRLNSLTAVSCSLAFAVAALGSSSTHASLIYAAEGTVTEIAPILDAFRSALGPLNPNVIGPFAGGRREINWDGVPDVFAAPNNLPGDFFNSLSPRGIVLSTPGTGFAVSAANGSGTPAQFGNIDANFPTILEPFSGERMFSALGSTVTDVHFFVPGLSTAALSRGFGVVFNDVDPLDTTSLQFFDSNDILLDSVSLTSSTGNETFLFAGVIFDEAVVSHVRIVSGYELLEPGSTGFGLVVMDDFIYGEPIAVPTNPVPEPAPLMLLGLGLVAMGIGRQRARNRRDATSSSAEAAR